MTRLDVTIQLGAAVLLSPLASPAWAQLPPADAGLAGLGTVSPALVRGFSAVAVNPAALGLSRTPDLSATFLSLGVRSGMDPVSMGDLAHWEGREVPRSVRENWLDDVEARGSQAGAAGVDLTLSALSRGRFGLQLSTRAHGSMRLNPDAAELLLFGNAGRDGSARDFALAGSGGAGWVVSTASVAYGRPVGQAAGGALHLGGTLGFSLGHVVGLGRDNGSALGGDPTRLDLRLPVVHVASGAGGLENGRGMGLDLGALWAGESVTLGAAVRNVVNTFSWALDDLVFRPGSAVLDADGSSTDFDERPAEEAPPVLLDALDDLTFRRSLAIGFAWAARPDRTFTADLLVEGDGGMAPDPDLLLGVGVELRSRPRLPLRAGIAVVERGVQLSAGAGLDLGRVRISGSGAFRTGSLDDLVLGTLGASVGH